MGDLGHRGTPDWLLEASRPVLETLTDSDTETETLANDNGLTLARLSRSKAQRPIGRTVPARVEFVYRHEGFDVPNIVFLCGE